MFTIEELLPTYDPKFVAIGDRYMRIIEEDVAQFSKQVEELDSRILAQSYRHVTTGTGTVLSVIRGGK